MKKSTTTAKTDCGENMFPFIFGAFIIVSLAFVADAVFVIADMFKTTH